MTPRKRITLALVALIALVVVGWLFRDSDDDGARRTGTAVESELRGQALTGGKAGTSGAPGIIDPGIIDPGVIDCGKATVNDRGVNDAGALARTGHDGAVRDNRQGASFPSVSERPGEPMTAMLAGPEHDARRFVSDPTTGSDPTSDHSEVIFDAGGRFE